ncbi:MAG: hypothetical protein RID18_00395 [Cytophagales bacterium]
MDLNTTKIELAKLILSIDNQKVIDKIVKLLKSESKDFWLELSDAEKEGIQMGLDQLDQGKRVSLEDFLKKVS